MAFTSTFQSRLDEFAKFRPGKLRVVDNADQSIVATIDLGVLFIMSSWSAQSHVARASLMKTLERVDPAAILELVIVDNDSLGDLASSSAVAGRLHGYGETAWIRDGQIISTTGKCDYETEFERHARQLIEISFRSSSQI